MPLPLFLLVAAMTVIWGSVMVALLAGFRRQPGDPEFRTTAQPLTLLDEIRIEV